MTYLEAVASNIRLGQPPTEHAARKTVFWAGLALLCSGALTTLLFGYHAGFAPLNAFGARVPSILLENLTYTGDSLFALVMMLIFARRYPQVLWTAVVAAVIATLASHGMKNVFDAARPPGVLQDELLHLVGPGYRRHSFPSGHSVTALVMTAAIVCYLPTMRARLIGLGVGGLIAASRVWVGVHWPVDVLIGAGLGALSVWAGARITLGWQWGARLTGHLCIVTLLGGCAIGMLVTEIPYPGAEPLARTIALIALLFTVGSYVLTPLLRRRAAINARSRRMLAAPESSGGA